MPKLSKSTITIIFAFLFAAILALMFIFNGIEWYARSFTAVKETIESRFTSFPISEIDDGLKRIFGLYLSQTNRAVENGIITLLDGRRVFEESPASPIMYERAGTIITLNDYLQSKNTPFMFVRAPNGMQDYSQLPLIAQANVTILEDTELFLDNLRENGVDVLDLRVEMKKDNIDYSQHYFWGDHHWNAYGALYGYGKIAETMNSKYGFNIDENTWNPNSYDAITFHNAFIGTASQRLDNAREDITVLLPEFETQIEVKSIYPFEPEKHLQTVIYGNFQEVFVPRAFEQDVTDFDYSDLISAQHHVNRYINSLAGEKKKILLLADSFGYALTYFATGLETFDHLTISASISPWMYPMLAGEDYDMVIFLVFEGCIVTDAEWLGGGRFNFGEPID